MKRPPQPRPRRSGTEPKSVPPPRRSAAAHREVLQSKTAAGGAKSSRLAGRNKDHTRGSQIGNPDEKERSRYYPSTRATAEFGERHDTSNASGLGVETSETALSANTFRGRFGKWRLGRRKPRLDNELSLRRREIQRAHRRRLLRYLIMSLATIAVVAALVALAFFSPLFALDPNRVKVRGANAQVPQSQVQQAIQPYAHIPLPRLRTGAIREAVESITMVKSATVSRHWPRGLDIAITVRQPVLAVAVGEKWEVLDDQGVKLRETNKVEEGLVKAELTTKEGTDRSAAVNLIVKVLNSVNGDFKAQIDTMVSDGVSVEIRTVDGPLIKWGDAKESDFKAQVVQLLMKQRPAQVYDVSTPTRPVTS